MKIYIFSHSISGSDLTSSWYKIDDASVTPDKLLDNTADYIEYAGDVPEVAASTTYAGSFLICALLEVKEYSYYND